MLTENTPARTDCYRRPTLLWQSQVKGQALTSVTDFLRTGHQQGTRPHPHPTASLSPAGAHSLLRHYTRPFNSPVSPTQS